MRSGDISNYFTRWRKLKLKISLGWGSQLKLRQPRKGQKLGNQVPLRSGAGLMAIGLIENL